MPACSNLRGESGPSSPSRSAYAGLAFIHITYMKRCFNLKIQIFLKMYIIELPPPGTLKYLSDPTPPPSRWKKIILDSRIVLPVF